MIDYQLNLDININNRLLIYIYFFANISNDFELFNFFYGDSITNLSLFNLLILISVTLKDNLPNLIKSPSFN